MPSSIGRWNALRPGDQAGAARALVHDGRAHGLGQVAVARRRAARVDERDAAGVAVEELVAREVDRVVARQVRVDLLVRLPVRPAVLVEHVVAAVVLGQLLLDDVGLDRHAEVVGLAAEVGGQVVVGAVHDERRVAQVAPQHGEHPELMGLLEQLGDLHDLPAAVVGAEVDRRADAGGAHVPRALDAAELHLVVLVRVREQLVVVELHDQGELVRPLAADRAEDAERRGERVAAAVDGEAHEVLGVEVGGVGREARARRVLDALVDREDRHVARAGEAARVHEPGQVAQHVAVAVAVDEQPVHPVGPGQVEQRLRHGRALVLEQVRRIVAEQLLQT